MSNTTQPSQPSGDSRRRRSRGGKNRNSNHQGSRHGGDREPREPRGERGERGERSDRGNRDSNRKGAPHKTEEFRPQAPRRTYAPPKMTLWQKLLNMVGLYKAPTPPARAERQPEPSKTRDDSRSDSRTKSNVRNARTGEESSPTADSERGEAPRRDRERGERGERGERKERGERGGRSGERPRGGDGSTVESPRVYVGNLSYDVSEQDLQELFKGIGAVRNVEIVYNRSTHRSKGYGFVEMLRMDEAVRSVEVLHDQPFMGRNLVVSGAKSKGYDEREDKDESPERESRPVRLAALPAAAAVAAVVETAAPLESAAPEEDAVIETIVETPVAEAPTESAEDLVGKYGFDEPAREPEKSESA